MAKPHRAKSTLADVGQRLFAARQALGLSARAVCEAISVRPNTYSQWENGKALIDPLAATRLKERYGISLDYLYAGDLSGLPFSLGIKIQAHG